MSTLFTAVVLFCELPPPLLPLLLLLLLLVLLLLALLLLLAITAFISALVRAMLTSSDRLHKFNATLMSPLSAATCAATPTRSRDGDSMRLVYVASAVSSYVKDAKASRS
jgi:hypothetical protein